MAEATEYIWDDKESEIELKKFVKKFVKTSPQEAKQIRARIEALNLMKIKTEHIAKIIDFLPEDAEGLNKIFVDASLDEDETKKILDTIKEFK